MPELSESDRLAYLQALNISVWQSRWDLPNALAPVLAPAEVNHDDAIAFDNTTASDKTETTQAETAQNLAPQAKPKQEKDRLNLTVNATTNKLTAPKTDTKLNAQQSSSVAETAETKNANTGIRFACQIIYIPNRLLILASLEDPNQPGFSSTEHQLMTDIIQAIQSADEAPAATIQIQTNTHNNRESSTFKWPLLNAGPLPKHAQAATEALNSFISSKALPQHADCLLLGKEMVELIAGTAYSSLLKGSSPTHAQGQTICLPSLADMLRTPTLKAVAWKQLSQSQSFSKLKAD